MEEARDELVVSTASKDDAEPVDTAGRKRCRAVVLSISTTSSPQPKKMTENSSVRFSETVQASAEQGVEAAERAEHELLKVDGKNFVKVGKEENKLLTPGTEFVEEEIKKEVVESPSFERNGGELVRNISCKRLC